MNTDRDDPNAVFQGLQPLAPPNPLRASLLREVHGRRRYWPFAAELAALCDLPLERMRQLLSEATEPDRWQPGLVDGFALIHFRPGDKRAGLHAGFARMPEGFEIPEHGHRDEEVVFILEGLIEDGTGQRFARGQPMRQAPGTRHRVKVRQACTVVSLVGELTP